MSQSHLSTNLDKIIQLISIEQIMGLMKQMKTGVDIATTTTNSSKEKEDIQVPKFECILPDKMNEQLDRINNTLLLIVDKISAIESEIQTLKECKQRSKSDADSEFNEEHIVLKIEEKEVVSKIIVDNLNIDDEEASIEDVDLKDDEDLDNISEDAGETLEDNKDPVVKEEVEEEVEEEVVNEEVEVVSEEVEVVSEEVEVVSEEDDSEKEISDESEEEASEEEASEEEVSEDEVGASVGASVEEDVKEEQQVAAAVVVTPVEDVVVEVEEVEEEDEEVFEIEIDDITYYATHEENGILYEVDKDGEVGKKVGIIKDGEPIFS
jgi:hypothetical protein